jgi:hypothetical protein
MGGQLALAKGAPDLSGIELRLTWQAFQVIVIDADGHVIGGDQLNGRPLSLSPLAKALPI